MSRLAIFISFCIIPALFLSCHSSSDSLLDEAESIMEISPDSALNSINQIDTSQLSTAGQKSRYALLLTQTKVKTRNMPDNDTIIRKALNYYSMQGKSKNLMKSLFYTGYIAKNTGKITDAFNLGLNARDIAVEYKDSYWIAKTSELLADILMVSFQDSAALPYRDEAIEHYRRSGRELNRLYATLDLGISYFNIQDYSRSSEILDSLAKEIPLSDSTELLMVDCLSELFTIYKSMGNNTKADSILKIMESRSIEPVYTLSESAWLAKEDLTDSSYLNFEKIFTRFRFSSLTTQEKANYYHTKILYFTKHNRLDSAIYYYNKIFETQNNALDEMIVNSVVTAQKRYYEIKAFENSLNRKRDKKIYLIVIISLLVIVTLTVFIFRQKIKLKGAEIEGVAQDIILLNQRLKSKQNKIRSLTREKDIAKNLVHEHFIGKWMFLNKICNEYFDKNDSDISRKIMISRIEKEIKALGSAENLNQLEESLNQNMNNIITKIREQLPGIKEDDINLISLIYAGFSSKSICFIRGMTLNNYYVKKKRIRDKILSSSAKDRDLFLSHL